MKRLLTLAACCLCLMAGTQAHAQYYNTDLERTISLQEDAVRRAEQSKRDIDRRCERDIDRNKEAIERAESKIKEAKGGQRRQVLPSMVILQMNL